MKLVASKPRSKPGSEMTDGLFEATSPAFLREMVESYAVPRVFRTAQNTRVRGRIVDQFVTFGYERSLITEDTAGNVIAGHPGQAKVLVGAHYDSVPGTPGADDNASALAVLLSLARFLGPHAEVCLVAFNGEEFNLAGSRSFVEGLGEHRLEQVHILEMVGFTSHEPGSQRNPIPPIKVPTVGDFLGLVGTHRSRKALGKVMELADASHVRVVGLRLPAIPLEIIRKLAPHVFRSDQAPFWDAGIPALMWTDTAEFRNPHYHCSSDTPETLDYEFMAAVARLLARAVEAAVEKLDGISG